MTDEELAAVRSRAKGIASDRRLTRWAPHFTAGEALALVAEVERLREERGRLRAALGSADGVIRSMQDALGVEADTDAVIAAKDAKAEVVRLQRIINQVRNAVASAVNGPRLTIDGYDVRLGVLTAILDGEEQS